jgi:hypothetical protein
MTCLQTVWTFGGLAGGLALIVGSMFVTRASGLRTLVLVLGIGWAILAALPAFIQGIGRVG